MNSEIHERDEAIRRHGSASRIGTGERDYRKSIDDRAVLSWETPSKGRHSRGMPGIGSGYQRNRFGTTGGAKNSRGIHLPGTPRVLTFFSFFTQCPSLCRFFTIRSMYYAEKPTTHCLIPLYNIKNYINNKKYFSNDNWGIWLRPAVIKK